VDQRLERPHRESAATYRRRRLVAGGIVLALAALPVLLATRIGSPGEQAVEAAFAETTTPAVDATTTAVETSTSTHGDATATTVRVEASTSALVATSTVPSTSSPPATSASGFAGYSSPYEFLSCVRARESRGNYAAVSSGGGFFGAYQIDQITWDSTAEHAGLTWLRGVQPNLALPASQDAIAMALLQWQGAGPWAGGCTFPAPGT
jgi:hypothetical protein